MSDYLNGPPEPVSCPGCGNYYEVCECDDADEYDAPPVCYVCDAQDGEVCTCVRCSECGSKCDRLCIDDTCNAGPCCCSCAAKERT